MLLKIFKKNIPKDKLIGAADNLVTVAGIIMIGIGLYMVSPAVMFIGVGALLAFPGISGRTVK